MGALALRLLVGTCGAHGIPVLEAPVPRHVGTLWRGDCVRSRRDPRGVDPFPAGGRVLLWASCSLGLLASYPYLSEPGKWISNAPVPFHPAHTMVPLYARFPRAQRSNNVTCRRRIKLLKQRPALLRI